ncbi:MAG: DUF2497 domain-containing protein [Alphaproteobacteria bacterium]|nr:DUF2497 domain-containing protein [Alphaproteobacteria bacterium]
MTDTPDNSSSYSELKRALSQQKTPAPSTPSAGPTGAAPSAQTLDAFIRDMIQPQIQNWINENLPDMVSRSVAETVERSAAETVERIVREEVRRTMRRLAALDDDSN